MSTPFADILKDVHQPIRDQSSDVQAAPDPAPGNDAPKGETASTTEAPGTAQPATTVDDDEGETPSPDVYGKVPLKALESERAKRQDWKAKAIQAEERQRAAEEKLTAFEKARQETAQAQPAQPAQVRQPEAPNPVEDPEGFRRFIAQEAQQQRLHASEITLRQAKPDVDDKLKVFLAAAKENPSLLAKANAQPHPWGWMYEEAGRIASRNEIGDDPVAFRAKVEADVRAKIEAERRDAAPTLDHQPHKPPPSLAAARSSASGRAPAPQNGPAPLSALVGANAASVRR